MLSEDVDLKKKTTQQLNLNDKWWNTDLTFAL